MSKPKDTEARFEWYEHGRDLEKQFLKKVAPHFHIDIALHPKKDKDETVIDMVLNNKFPADLKTQNTPFFMASRYGVPAQYAVTFNHKDYKRYKRLYPHAIIFFWINWTTLSWNDKKVKPMNMVVKVPFWKLARDIEQKKVKLHQYKRRVGDTSPNAKDSYVLDIRKYTKIGDL